jgi:hypothetical protein
MADVLEFYADPGRLTEVSRHEELLNGLPDDLGELTRIIQGVGIYDVVAPDFYGVEVPKSRAQEIQSISGISRSPTYTHMRSSSASTSRDSTFELATHAHADRVREDFMSGVRSGVNGTPTFYINGARHDSSYDISTLLAALERAAEQP